MSLASKTLRQLGAELADRTSSLGRGRAALVGYPRLDRPAGRQRGLLRAVGRRSKAFLDGCALSLPCHRSGEAPVGLMLAGLSGQDRRLQELGLAVGQALGQ